MDISFFLKDGQSKVENSQCYVIKTDHKETVILSKQVTKNAQKGIEIVILLYINCL
jgi:hypothetical protein